MLSKCFLERPTYANIIATGMVVIGLVTLVRLPGGPFSAYRYSLC